MVCIPNWAGHTVMAYAFLKGMGLDGEIGTFTVDLKKNEMKTTAGHEVVAAKDGEFQIKSSRYPFCPCLNPKAAPRAIILFAARPIFRTMITSNPA